MEDKRRILKMVEEGKLNSEEAIKLLEALDSDVVVKKDKDDEFFNIDKSKSNGKMIYVRVKSGDGEKVKVNVPVDFIKIVGGNFANVNLEKHNVNIDELITAVENGFEGRIVEVESDDGDRVVIEIG